jgi:hypothetical protein
MRIAAPCGQAGLTEWINARNVRNDLAPASASMPLNKRSKQIFFAMGSGAFNPL